MIELPTNLDLPNDIDPAWLSGGAGAVLLLFGRKLFHLVLGVAAFFVGFTFIGSLGLEVQPALQLAAGLVSGVAAVLLAFFVKSLALTLGGVVLGAFAGLWTISALPLHLGGLEWGIPVVGAVVSAVMIHRVFDLALAVLSSFVGASMIMDVLPLEGGVSLLAGVALFGFGVISQMSTADKDSRRERRRERRKKRRRKQRAELAET